MFRIAIFTILLASILFALETPRHFIDIPQFLDFSSIISKTWAELTAKMPVRDSFEPDALPDHPTARGVDPASSDAQQTPADLANALEEEARRSIVSQDDDAEVVLKVDLQKEKKRSAALAERLAAMERNTIVAAVQIETLQKRLEAGDVRSASLDGNLTDTRKKLARTIREASLGDDARRSRDAIAAADRADLIDTRKKIAQALREAYLANDARRTRDAIAAADRADLEREHTRSAELASALEDARRQAFAQIGAPRQGALSTRASLERPNSGGSESAKPSGAAPKPLDQTGTASDPLPSVAAPTSAPSTGISLPEGAVARVVLRYARNSRSARMHALNLSMMLRAQGLEVSDPVAATTNIAADSVTFFYKEDKSSAKHIASIVVTSTFIQSRLPADEPLPRPGTIEVSLAG